MGTETTFSANEAAKIAGITYRQIDYWINQGYFKPQVQAKLIPFDSEEIEGIALNAQRNGRVTKILKTGELRNQLAEAISLHKSSQGMGR